MIKQCLTLTSGQKDKGDWKFMHHCMSETFHKRFSVSVDKSFLRILKIYAY